MARCSPTRGSMRSCSGRRRGRRGDARAGAGRARRRARGGARCRRADELCRGRREALFAAIRRGAGADGAHAARGRVRAIVQESACEHTEIASKLERARLRPRPPARSSCSKGADTVVAAPDGRAASPRMRRPGSRPPAPATCWPASLRACWRRACRPSRRRAPALWLHGEAGNEAGPGLIAEDLPEALPAVYRRLFAISTPGSTAGRSGHREPAASEACARACISHLPGLSATKAMRRVLPAAGTSDACRARTASSRRRARSSSRTRWPCRCTTLRPRCGSRIASTTVRPRLTENSGLPCARSAIVCDRDFGPQRAAKSMRSGSAIRRQRLAARPAARRGRAAGRCCSCRSGASAALALDDQRAMLPGSSVAVDEQIDAVAGRERDPAVARRKRLGRLAVDRHHAQRDGRSMRTAQEPRRAALSRRSRSALVGRDRNVERCGAVDGGPRLPSSARTARRRGRRRPRRGSSTISDAVEPRGRRPSRSTAGGTRRCRRRAA